MLIHLGRERTANAGAVELPVHALLRHFMALGSSGSGKTVLCKIVVEEAVRCGVPVICIDPQGDLCSLALTPSADETTSEHTGDASAQLPDANARAFADKADVVVFTPASRKGVPLCADPLSGTMIGLAPDDRLHARTRAADMIASLLSYDADSDDGAGLRAVIDTALSDMEAEGRPAHRLDDLTGFLGKLGQAEFDRYGRYLDARKLRTACQRLARLDVGARRLLFHEGVPIDIDMLLGLGDRPGTVAGKTRVSVIYLNTLHSQDDKDFFVAALIERLYAWMLQNPSTEPQALLYIDEIAPFLPPVRKPACKPGLQLLFKQARKYGVCCLMATQNPGDVDYKAMAQFGTWALGRLTMRQDIEKVASVIKSLAPDHADRILSELPALRPGHFLMLSPDHFEGVRALLSRWLYSAHHTLDEERIEALTDERWRGRFAAPAPARPRQDPAPTPARPRQNTAPAAKRPKAPAPAKAASAESGAQSVLERMTCMLSKRKSMNAREFAAGAGISENKARRVLKELLAAGAAASYRDRRTTRYFARGSGARPDLDLGSTVAVVKAELDEARAREQANNVCRSGFLGLMGGEELESMELVYRPVYQVVFEETVTRTGLERLLGPSEEQLLGTVYHHPTTLQVLLFSPKRGIEFADDPGVYASRVADFDGVVQFADVAPGTLRIDEAAWRARRTTSEVKAHFRGRFAASPKRVTPYFVPLWRLMLRQRERGNYRVVFVDAIVGKPVSWTIE